MEQHNVKVILMRILMSLINCKSKGKTWWIESKLRAKTYSIGIRNWTVSGGCSFPGLTRVKNQLGLKILNWGLPSWYRGYLQTKLPCLSNIIMRKQTVFSLSTINLNAQHKKQQFSLSVVREVVCRSNHSVRTASSCNQDKRESRSQLI